MNDAVDKVALLTKNEFAELSLIYVLTLTRSLGINNYEKLIEYLSSTVLPFVDDVSSDQSSHLYLKAQSCGQLPSLLNRDLRTILISNYGGVISNGVSKDQFKSSLPAEWQHLVGDPEMVVPCLHDDSKWQIGADNKETFQSMIKKLGVPDDIATNFWSVNESAFWSKQEMIDGIGARLPKFIELERLWSSTPLRSFRLSTVGIAIGHANARRVAKLDADLSFWIK